MSAFVFFGVIGAGVLVGWAALRIHEAREALEDQRRFDAFQRHLRSLQAERRREGSE